MAKSEKTVVEAVEEQSPGFALKRVVGRPSNIQKGKIIEALVSGQNLTDVSEATGVSEGTLKEWLAALQPHELVPRKEVRDAMASQRYYTKKDFNYVGRSLARGEVFTMGRSQNDEKLVRIGYCVPLPPGVSTYKDDKSGREFKSQAEAYSFSEARAREQAALRAGNNDEYLRLKELQATRDAAALGIDRLER